MGWDMFLLGITLVLLRAVDLLAFHGITRQGPGCNDPS
jgi:hypothetical protein